MQTKPTPALLPAGLRDLLPPEAKLEADAVHALVNAAGAHGYLLVKPPLAEFEDGLLADTGQSLGRQIFRFMDPHSQQMLAVRADMTPQIARIASTRLVQAPRPLRLVYSGEVLRISGTALRPERQFCQMGCELIGVDDLASDVEIILLARACLNALGLDKISVDLNLPMLVPALLREIDPEQVTFVTEEIARRDSATLRQRGSVGVVFEKLVLAAGPALQASQAIRNIDLPEAILPDVDRLLNIAASLEKEKVDLAVTIDPVERRGFEYQSGVSFTFFCQNHGEIGRGGRYNTGGGKSEPAVGFTVFLDRLLAALSSDKGDK